MSGTPQLITAEGTASSSRDDEPEFPIKDQPLHARSPPDLSSRFRTNNYSAASFESNLFTHSWNRLGSYSIPDLCSYIESTPPAPISLLKWCKGRNGLRHEFLLLKVDRPENGKTLWLRLERRVHENATAANCIISPVLSGDTVKLSSDFSRLFDASESEVQVETKFPVPLPLQTLHTLLSILMEESPDYKLYSENCYFFCAVIYENLKLAGNGVDVAGTPSKVSTSFGPKARGRIKRRMTISPSEPSDSFSGLKSLRPQVPYIPLPTLIEQLPTRATVVRETEETVPRHPTSSQEALDPHIKHEPAPYNRISTSDRSSSVIKSGNVVSLGILPDIPPDIGEDGHQAIRVDPRSDAAPSRPEAHPDELHPALDHSHGRMCVGVDFGTEHSAVACGISPQGVEQILLIGPNGKAPTSLVYDAKGRVVSWGHRAQTIDLEKGWIRCEKFKHLLDPAGGLDCIPTSFPLGKEPINIIADYLRELWQDAKPRIFECGYSKEGLQSADIWLSIPAIWNLRSGEIMRDAAYAAGLTAPKGTQEYAGGRDRLHIISESEAGAVYCGLWKDLNLKQNQSFMVCDAGGATIDTAIYQVLGNVTQIAERCASSDASCGSHFLDIHFRTYLEEWHRARNIRLSEKNLIRYMHAFTYSQKLEFTGREDGRDLLFECFDVSDYDRTDLSDAEFFNGKLVVPVNDLRERVFDPIVNKVLRLLEAQLQRVGLVDALFLMGGFSANQYLFDRIWDTFHEHLHDRILKSSDPERAKSLGAAQSGLAQSLIQWPIGAPTIIASKSYIIGAGPNRAIGPEGNWNTGNAAEINGSNEVFEPQYLVVKGAVLRKGEAVLEEFTKTSSDASDSIFIARLYSSDSEETQANMSGDDLKHIQDWKIDLSGASSFRENAQNSPQHGFDTVFEIGIEIESQATHVLWYCGGKEHGRLRLPDVFGN